ncbi:MAG TPA: FAD-dependent oxidoreductase [Chloroflexota bacterium]|nr:FAD-dependent oxidoreductase [Chloroflexota bacterium]
MRAEARVVVVGAGIVGCSIAYHLARMGWRDVVVLDRGPLFHNQGSTSHAPGLMFQHNVSRTMCQLAVWSVELYGQLRPQGGAAFHQVGSLEIASTPERWLELKRRVGQARSWGLEAELIGPDEARRLVPVMRVDDLYGALHVPSDCVVKASAIAEALARSAEQSGAGFHPDTPVSGIELADGRVRAVVTPRGRVRTELVVCAAGIWGPLIGRIVGVPIPLSPMQHLFARTGPLPELAGETAEIRHAIVRHQDKDLYFRQYGEAYGFGSYRHEPLALDPEAISQGESPAVLPFTAEHFRESLEDAHERIPSLRAAGLSGAFNGLFSFTPDGLPLLGESLDVGGFWVAEAVWITHAAGVGRVVAESIVGGRPSIDLRECDLNRFPPHALSRSFVRTRACQQYVEVYDVIHPLQQMEHPRGLRVSPFQGRLEELGAVFFESAGWERPQWFESNEHLLTGSPDGAPCPARSGWTARHWSRIIGAEHAATRSRVALFDLSPFTKLEVAGPGALAFLQRLCANQIDRPPGAVVYSAMLDDGGGIRCDLTVTRLEAERFLVLTGGATGARDLAWMRQHLPADGSVRIDDVTSGRCCVGVWGPLARDLAQRVSDDDLSNAAFPYFTARRVTIGWVPTLALRLSYVGELGWEIYAPTEYGRQLWDTLWAAGQSLGVVAAGGGAFDSLRLEKGRRLWGQDIHTEYNPYEAGLGFAVALGKGDFLGRPAMQHVKAEGPRRRLSCLTFDDPAIVVMGKEPILDRGRVLGYVTSANYGYTVGHSIAYGYLPIEYAAPGVKVEVQFFGQRHGATVAKEPLYDPGDQTLRS